MIKRLFVFLLIAGFAAGAVSAWEPNDLTKYPSCMQDGSWILNLGIGFYLPRQFGGGYTYIPAVRLSADRNTALGENKLPFFFGGLFSYSGEGYGNIWFVHRISIGGRFGYHFNWGVDKLDTYAVTTAGINILAGDSSGYFTPFDWVLFGVNLGVRYFFTDWFGLWTEAALGSLFSFDLGVSFKF